MQSARNNTIDILKGIGIILVVIGHCLSRKTHGDLPIDFIYSFHMPLFFIASGIFFSEKCLNNKKEFILRKIRGIYIPFLKWSFIFLALHNVFFTCGIINAEYGNSAGVTSSLFSLKETIINALFIITTMTHYDGFLLGAFWFMRALLIGSLLLCFCSYLLNKIVKNPIIAIAVTSLILGVAGGIKVYFQIGIPGFPKEGYRELMAAFFIGMGYLIRQYGTKRISNITYGIPALLILLLCLFIHPATMNRDVTFNDWAVIPFSGVSGFVVVYILSHWIDSYIPWMRNTLVYIGKRSLYILTFHFIMFKPAALLQTYIYDLDWRMIGCFPIISLHNEVFWIIYAVSSIVFCLLIEKLLNPQIR